MPTSKKKARTSAKKKAKAIKKLGADDYSLSSEMQRMKVGGHRSSTTTDECNHGLDLSKKGMDCVGFVQRWLQEYNTAIDKVGNMEIAFKITHAVTKAYAVWEDPASIDWLVSYFLMTATKQFLIGKIDTAGVDASYAYFFEQHKAVELSNMKSQIDWHEVASIHNADRPTLAIFLRERIPCECMG